MKEVLLQYMQYNLWANQCITATILKLPAEKQTREIASSFPSLYKTLLHMWDAESAWWQRVKLQEKVVVPSASFNGDMDELVKNMLQQSQDWLDWVKNASEVALQHEFIYQNSKREQFKQPVFQMLLHVCNHGTYHRGQLVTMLRPLGVDIIPALDFIVWSRKK